MILPKNPLGNADLTLSVKKAVHPSLTELDLDSLWSQRHEKQEKSVLWMSVTCFAPRVRISTHSLGGY